MTAHEWAEDIGTLTREQAMRLVRKAGDYDLAEFLSDMGEHETYDAVSVVEWMGF